MAKHSYLKKKDENIRALGFLLSNTPKKEAIFYFYLSSDQGFESN